MTHMHITTWVLGLILFIVALSLYKKGSEKPATIVHMILRLMYILIIITGGLLTWEYIRMSIGMPLLGEVIVKVLAGIWVVSMMEMILVGKKKGKAVTGRWIQFGIALVIVIVLGFFRLPMGFLF